MIAFGWAWALRPLLGAWVAWPLVARIIVAVGLVGGVGAIMGVMLPSGVSVLSERDGQVVPWAWGINGAASVVGTVVATVTAIRYGCSATLRVGAALCLCAAVLAYLLTHQVLALPGDEPVRP